MQPKGRNENWSAPVRSTCGRMQNTIARVLQDLFERFAGNALDESLDETGQPGGNPGCERNRFRLHVSAAVAFDEPPVSGHAPHVASVFSFGKRIFTWGVMVLDFANTLRAAVAPGMSRIEGVVVDLKNRVEHDGDHLLAEISNRNFEVAAIVLENL